MSNIQKCSACKCKCLLKEFKINRLNKLGKICERCRERRKRVSKNHYAEHKNEIKQYQKRYRMEHANKIKQYREDNKNEIRERNKKYRDEHKTEINMHKTQYQKERRNYDPLFKLICNMRIRVCHILVSKSKHTIDYLNCSSEFLTEYLEKQFTNGMTWDNYGTYWHVDHIVPLKWNNPTEEEVIRRLAYWNLCPLIAVDNLEKQNNLSFDDVMKATRAYNEYSTLRFNNILDMRKIAP